MYVFTYFSFGTPACFPILNSTHIYWTVPCQAPGWMHGDTLVYVFSTKDSTWTTSCAPWFEWLTVLWRRHGILLLFSQWVSWGSQKLTTTWSHGQHEVQPGPESRSLWLPYSSALLCQLRSGFAQGTAQRTKKSPALISSLCVLVSGNTQTRSCFLLFLLLTCLLCLDLLCS